MPSNWLYVDTNFQTFTGEESTEAKISTTQNYLFMLVEQLRYSLHNLDSGNMNPSALNRYASGLTDPIYRKLSDSEGNITQLQIDAKGLQMQITNNAGDIHNLSITAGNLASQIKDANGNISSLQQTANSINISVSNLSGDVSRIRQTVNSITLSVTNGENSTLHVNQLYGDSIAIKDSRAD